MYLKFRTGLNVSFREENRRRNDANEQAAAPQQP
jgi:hypothetical protein